ncbi:QcrA and Rieske domain-containing protein [Leptothrix discophora]|uniref:Rieske 2Fe-2S domain-containing protein n=1 Tax=Leptothrix discophora TaxID=89 RepID=A0ABT9G4J4_LEPDI|nr:Rieske 2Fe-2S domain-containing protein [Leptothrix discophora]MDP4301409.1 Rieske 2Fe-2S domain-containing protein [Leptothrix discophora]
MPSPTPRTHELHANAGCGCTCKAAAAAAAVDAPRRRLIQIAAAGVVAPLAFAAAPAWSRPQAGDLLVEEDAEGTPAPLRLADIPMGKPMLAFPYDAAGKKARDETRLNKVALMRFAEADLDAESRARSAGGVLAFSAICTHQGCDVKTWSTKEQVLICFCHSSKFRLREGGVVASGPATRPLPSLPLKLVGDQLAIADGFSAAPGGQPA